MVKDFQQQRVVDHYDDHIQKLIPGYGIIHRQIHALLQARLADDAKILIVGCGTGYEVNYVLEQFPQAQITALDPSLNMMNKAKERLAGHPQRHRIHFMHADTSALIDMHHYDVALVILVAHFITMPQKHNFFRDIYRSLKLGGCLFSYDLMQFKCAKQLQALQYFCQNNGLSLQQSQNMAERIQQDFSLIFPQQYENILYDVGFRDVDCYSKIMNYYGFQATK